MRTAACYYRPQKLREPFATLSAVSERAFSQIENPQVSGPVQPIQTVLAIGACYIPGIGFAPNDEEILLDALSTARRSGLPVSPAPGIAPANLTNGFDFLLYHENKLQADMIVTCLVYNPPREEKVGEKGLHPSRLTSSWHRWRGVWARAAARVGARAIVAYSIVGAHREIAGRHFVHDKLYRIKQSTIGVGSFEGEPLRLRRDLLLRTNCACG